MKIIQEKVPFDDDYSMLFIGPGVGKEKFIIVDGDIISMLMKYLLECHLFVDPNGTGAIPFCRIYPKHANNSQAVNLHNMLWLNFNDFIPAGYKVVHKNRISMDNRMSNLMLLDETKMLDHYSLLTEDDLKASVYHQKLLQLSLDRIYQVREQSKIYWYSLFYECHNTFCLKLERQPSTFYVCGRCRKARYCGSACQTTDWPIHQNFCVQDNNYILQKIKYLR